jgi:hypothetical protein
MQDDTTHAEPLFAGIWPQRMGGIVAVTRDEEPVYVQKFSKAGPIVETMWIFLREHGHRLRSIWVEERRPFKRDSQTEVWNQGRIYGIVCAALEAWGCEYQSVPPHKWALSFVSDLPLDERYKDTRNQLKHRLREYTAVAKAGARQQRDTYGHGCAAAEDCDLTMFQHHCTHER